jgi:hypothetical protein
VIVMIGLLASNWQDTGDPCGSRWPARIICRARSARRGTAADDRRPTASPASSHEQSSRTATGDIHRVRNTGDTTSISIHIYGTDVTRIGSSLRRYYD